MKIILVDDELLILDELEYLCSQVKDVKVCGAFSNPLEALQYVREHAVDFAFLDIRMPGLTGLELLHRMREIRPQLQAAFVTAYDEYALEAYRNDVCDYLMKPFQMKEVEHALDKARRLLKDSGADAPQKPVVEIRTFGRFDIMKDGHALDFTSRKAKELLALLVSRRGGMVEMEYAVEMLWEDEPYSEKVKVKFRKALMNLRNTLKEHGLIDLIQVQRGRVYLDCRDIDCDYFRLLDGETEAARKFQGEFLSEYSWGEPYIPNLEQIAERVLEEWQE